MQLPEFLIFFPRIVFLWTSNYFLIKNWFYSDGFWCDFSYAIIGIYKITEHCKYFEKKICKKNQENLIFDLKINFYSYTNIFLIWNTVDSDRSQLALPDEAIRIKNFYFSRKLWWKNCWKLPKWLRCRKVHGVQTIRNINSKFW